MRYLLLVVAALAGCTSRQAEDQEKSKRAYLAIAARYERLADRLETGPKTAAEMAEAPPGERLDLEAVLKDIGAIWTTVQSYEDFDRTWNSKKPANYRESLNRLVTQGQLKIKACEELGMAHPDRAKWPAEFRDLAGKIKVAAAEAFP